MITRLAPAIVAAALCCPTLILRWTGPVRHAPLAFDEVHSVEFYTWAGCDSRGFYQPIRRIDDLRNLPSPSLKRLGFGLYRAVALWKEPNNHVIHSVLLNFSLCLPFSLEERVRLPAFLGAIALSLLTGLVVCEIGHPNTAPLAALVAYGCAFVAHYSCEARGYTWTLALQVGWLCILERLIRKPHSISLGASGVAIAVASVMNQLNLLADWILPVVIVFSFVNHNFIGDRNKSRQAYRTAIAAQSLAVLALSALFVIDRLPYVLFSAGQYGYAVHSLDDILFRVIQQIRFLFPTPLWALVAIAGVIGPWVRTGEKSIRRYGILTLVVVAVSYAHFLIARRFPYPRAVSYIWPVLFVGFGYFLNLVLERLRPRLRLMCALVFGLLVAGVSAREARLALSPSDNPLMTAIYKAHADRPRYLVFPMENGYLTPKLLPLLDYVPSQEVEWNRIQQLCLVIQRAGHRWTIDGYHGGTKVAIDYPTQAENLSPTASDIAVLTFNGRFVVVDDLHIGGDIPPLLVWVPEWTKIGMAGPEIQALLDEDPAPLRLWRRPIGFKLDYGQQVSAVEYLPQSRDEYERLRNHLARCVNRFGGSVYAFQTNGSP